MNLYLLVALAFLATAAAGIVFAACVVGDFFIFYTSTYRATRAPWRWLPIGVDYIWRNKKRFPPVGIAVGAFGRYAYISRGLSLYDWKHRNDIPPGGWTRIERHRPAWRRGREAAHVARINAASAEAFNAAREAKAYRGYDETYGTD